MTHLQLEENLSLSRCYSIWICLSPCTQTCSKYAESPTEENEPVVLQQAVVETGCFGGTSRRKKGVSWVVWKLLQMGQIVVLLKARKQVHTMSFFEWTSGVNRQANQNSSPAH